MPEGANQEERTESATPKRREETREKGQVAKSTDLTSAFMFLVGLAAIRFFFPSIFSQLMHIIESTFSHMSDAAMPIPGVGTSTGLHHYGISTLAAVGRSLAPYAAVMFASALVINYAQVGFLVSKEALLPKFERINPVKGLTRLVSKKTVVMLVQSLFKVFIVGYILYITVKGEKDMIMGMADMPIRIAISKITGLIFSMGFRAAILLFVLACFDYAYQRWDYERNIRMTKQEVKEEMKQSEGDPLVKSRIRSIQREMAMRRMMQEVPTADVVITNPTHIAIALRYAMEVDAAPKVVAKGSRLIAERIKAVAREHNVPVVEDRPLARALHKLKLGQEIPVALYKAVAEILSRIMNL